MQVAQLAELIPLRRGEIIFDRRGGGTRRFNEYIEELTRQTNENTSNSEETNTQLSQAQGVISQLVGILNKQEVVVVTTSNITAKPFETIICNNLSTINVILEPNPIKGDIINIKRKNKPVRVIGPIDGKAFKVINVKYYSMKLIYDGIEWSEV